MVLVVKNLPANAGDIRDVGSIPGSGRSPGGRHGNPLHYSCLENCMDRGAWQATVHRVAKSQTRLKQLYTHTHRAVTQLHVRCMLSCSSHILLFATVWTIVHQPADGNCSHEIKRQLLLGRKAATNLDSILKSSKITLPTKVHIVRAMVFPVVIYGCESWTIEKAEH